METKYLLAVMFIFLLVPNVSALTGYNCTNEGNLITNITDITTGTEYIFTTTCTNGCTPAGGGTFVCATTSFFVPSEIYIMFELLAFAMFFMALYMSYGKGEDASNTVIFPALSLVMFSTMAVMSFNVEGLAFLAGAALNFSFALVSLILIIIEAMQLYPTR